MALHLDEAEADELLYRAGYSLSPNILFDSIVLFFLSRGHHDIFTLNEALVAYGLAPLQKPPRGDWKAQTQDLEDARVVRLMGDAFVRG